MAHADSGKASNAATPWMPSEATIRRLSDVAPAAEVVLLPERYEGDVGMYRDTAVGFVTALKGTGLVATTLDEGSQRNVFGEYSREVLVEIALGVAGNITWDAAKHLWLAPSAWAARRSAADTTPMVSLKVARLERDGVVMEGLHICAPAGEASADWVIGMLSQLAPPPASGDEEAP